MPPPLAFDASARRAMSSPNASARNAHRACPKRYGNHFGSCNSRIRGRRFEIDRIADPHRRVGIEAAERQELRHPFEEPERQRHRAAGLLEDVALEGMHELMPEHVIRFAQRRRERQDDPALLMIGEAPDAVGQLAGKDGRLAEVRRARIEHDWRPLAEGVIEGARTGACTNARPSPRRRAPPPARRRSSGRRSARCGAPGSRTSGTELCSIRSIARPRALPTPAARRARSRWL